MPQTTSLALATAARAAVERGWRVFPLAPNAKRPAVRAWEQRATADPARIGRCWAVGEYNLGIATGPSELVVIDLDISMGPDDAPAYVLAKRGITSGADMLAALAEEHGQPYPSETFTVSTPSGGTHLYFAAPDGVSLRNTAGKLGWKIDTRAGGGYVVGAHSVVNGKRYTVVHDAAPATLPTWLASLLTPAPLPPQRPVVVPLTTTGRHGAYLNVAINAEVRRVLKSGADQHNEALYRAAVALGQLVAGGELAAHQVHGWLGEAAAQVGQTPREIPHTIDSGLRAGAKRPRTVGGHAA